MVGPLFSIVAFVILILVFGPYLFNLLIRFMCSKLQQFQVRLKMAQGLQPILAEGSPGPYKSLEQSTRDFYTSRVN